MSLKMIRIEILKEIIEFYKNTEYYDTLMQLLEQNENIADLLKSAAAVYSLLMSNPILVWENNNASCMYSESLTRYQKGYELYSKFACYFLGDIVMPQSLELASDESLEGCSLLQNDKIDYVDFLESIDLEEPVKLG